MSHSSTELLSIACFEDSLYRLNVDSQIYRAVAAMPRIPLLLQVQIISNFILRNRAKAWARTLANF